MPFESLGTPHCAHAVALASLPHEQQGHSHRFGRRLVTVEDIVRIPSSNTEPAADVRKFSRAPSISRATELGSDTAADP